MRDHDDLHGPFSIDGSVRRHDPGVTDSDGEPSHRRLASGGTCRGNFFSCFFGSADVERQTASVAATPCSSSGLVRGDSEEPQVCRLADTVQLTDDLPRRLEGLPCNLLDLMALLEQEMPDAVKAAILCEVHQLRAFPAPGFQSLAPWTTPVIQTSSSCTRYMIR